MRYLISLGLLETIFHHVVDRAKMELAGPTTIKRDKVVNVVVNELVFFMVLVLVLVLMLVLLLAFVLVLVLVLVLMLVLDKT